MSINVLIVDDNLDTIKTYTKALLRTIKTREEDRINIEFADTVSLALNKLNSQKTEILIVDLKIPGLCDEEWGGLEVIDKSRKLDQLRPIIAITGYGSVGLVKKTYAQGAFDFIEKSDVSVEELIQAVQKAIDTRYEKIMRSGNPFTPMSGMQPTVFGGRNKELEFFEQKLYKAIHNNYCEHFLILGEWGIGKSSLLREYKKICQSRGYITSIVSLESLQSGTKSIEAARSLIEGIIRDLPYPIERLKRVVNFFDSIGFSILGTGFQIKRNTQNQDISVQAFLHDSLMRLWQDLEDQTDMFVILIDELENFMTVPEIIMTLRSCLSMDSIKNAKILLGLSSTTSSWLTFTSVEKHHPLSRYFLSRVELKQLTEDELTSTVHQLLSDSGVSFSSEIMQRIFEYTEGHPFEMQLLGNHLFNNQLSGRVDIDVWDKALQDTLNDLGMAVFENWLDRVNSNEGKILNFIAQSENFVTDNEIQNLIQRENVDLVSNSFEDYIQGLLEKKLICKKGIGSYAIKDYMLKAYIRTLSC